MFPAIKTALVDVSHEIRMCDRMILKGYAELGLGRLQGWPHEPTCLVRIQTPQNSAFFHRTTHLQPAAPAGQSSKFKQGQIIN